MGVDGGVDFAKVLFVQVGKKHHVADAAVAAVRGAFPGRVNLDGDHVLNLARPTCPQLTQGLALEGFAPLRHTVFEVGTIKIRLVRAFHALSHLFAAGPKKQQGGRDGYFPLTCE